MRGQRDTLHVFKCQIGLTFRREPGVVESRDMRMRERRENIAFARESISERRPVARYVRQFERDRPFQQAVGALCEPDNTHAATPELAYEPVGTNEGADHRRGGCAAGVGGCREFRKCIEVIPGLDPRLLREHRAKHRCQYGIARSQFLEPTFALAFRQCQSFVEQARQRLPLFGGESHSAAPSSRYCGVSWGSADTTLQRALRASAPSRSPESRYRGETRSGQRGEQEQPRLLPVAPNR